MSKRLLTAAILIILPLICGKAAFGQGDAPAESDAVDRALRVWLPAPLIADEASEAFTLLREHTAAFSDNNGIAVEFRIKAVGAVGGIMSSIRSASEVAPGALPDIALIHRSDFTPNQARQYLQSLETLFSSALINELDNALESGQIPLERSVALYGLPYFLELLHAVYAGPLRDIDDGLSFEDVLASGAAMLFPAARPTGLNQTVYLQYLEAGAGQARDGTLAIDEAAISAVLAYYEQLWQRELISAETLGYQTPAAYQSAFIDSDLQPRIGIFTSSQYLFMRDQIDARLKAANLPTAGGQSLTTRDGWLWVIVAPDLTRQTYAARFLEWMTEPAFHAAIAKALYMLPSQSAALAESLPADLDRDFYAELLAAAIAPLPESEGGTAPRALQLALIQVLGGEVSAAEATQQIMRQFADS